MSPSNSNSNHSEDSIKNIKKEFDALSKRAEEMKDHGGEVMKEQFSKLAELIESLQSKGKEKSKEAADALISSTQEHPVRNLLYAFGLGALFSLMMKVIR